MRSKRIITVYTGSRADYGLLKPLIRQIVDDEALQLQLLVSGSHLSLNHGMTVSEIEQDGFHIAQRVEIDLQDDSALSVSRSFGLAVQRYAEALNDLMTDIAVILGDRYEALAMAVACLFQNVPVAHLNGGELTGGVLDDSIRHAITKLSHIHFVATEAYRQRVIQLGERPDSVFHVGEIGLDNIRDVATLSREELSAEFTIPWMPFTYLVTFHPLTIDQTAKQDFGCLLTVLDELLDSAFIFTKANADCGGQTINYMIDDFVACHRDRAVAFASMGRRHYLSAMRFCRGVIGNSSSGIVEAPSLMVGSINIGDRQLGRIRAASVIDCDATVASIRKAFILLNASVFQDELRNIQNPYYLNGDSSLQTKDILKTVRLDGCLNKLFYDLSGTNSNIEIVCEKSRW